MLLANIFICISVMANIFTYKCSTYLLREPGPLNVCQADYIQYASPLWFSVWAASSEFGTYCLREERRFRWACASAQSRQNLRCLLIQAVSQEEPSDRKPDPWPLWMAGHAELKSVMMECSKTQIRLTRYSVEPYGLGTQILHHYQLIKHWRRPTWTVCLWIPVYLRLACHSFSSVSGASSGWRTSWTQALQQEGEKVPYA